MYRRPIQKQPQQEQHRASIGRSRSQYLKQNWNPNTMQSHMSLLNTSQSISNIRRNEKRRSSLTHDDDEIKSTKKKSSNNINIKSNRPRGSHASIIEEKQPMIIQRPKQPLEEDFLRPQDIGMNSKAVHHQLQNAMQRQIQRQKTQIITLNSTIIQLKQKDKTQVTEITRLTNLIGQLQFRLIEEGRRKGQSARLLPFEDVQEQNRRLRIQLDQTQQMIKKILLQREKQRMFTFHN